VAHSLLAIGGITMSDKIKPDTRPGATGRPPSARSAKKTEADGAVAKPTPEAMKQHDVPVFPTTSEEIEKQLTADVDAVTDGWNVFYVLGVVSTIFTYHEVLNAVICRDPKNKGNKHLLTDEDYKSLDNSVGMLVLYMIWLRSAFPNDSAFDLLGFPARGPDGAPNANALGSAMHAEMLKRECARSKHRYVAQVRSVVAAAVKYGLVEVRSARGKGKPLHATPLCDMLVRSIASRMYRDLTQSIAPVSDKEKLQPNDGE
jgi:hypothetical protein